MKLVLGCFDERLHEYHRTWVDDTWTLSDINPRHPSIIKVDARAISFTNLKAIYASHVCEHIAPEDLVAMFEHWHDVLAPGGTIHINVPDMLWIAKEFLLLANGQEPTSKYFHTTNRLLEAVYGSVGETEYDKHRWGFTSETLHDFLFRAHFKNISVTTAYEAHDMGCLIAKAVK